MKFKGVYKRIIPTFGSARGFVIEQENGEILEFWCDFDIMAERIKDVSIGDSVIVHYKKDHDFKIFKN